jgi:hypothetical protein
VTTAREKVFYVAPASEEDEFPLTDRMVLLMKDPQDIPRYKSPEKYSESYQHDAKHKADYAAGLEGPRFRAFGGMFHKLS